MQEPHRNNPMNNCINYDQANRNFLIKIFYFTMPVAILVITYLFKNLASNFSMLVSNPNCDLTNPNNRDFNRFFGIKHNYFHQSNGENSGIPIYTPVIPDQIFKSLSFVVVAPIGSGKSLLRKHYISFRKSIIEILNHQVNDILLKFVTNIGGENNDTSQQMFIEKNWQEKDFEHTLLYLFSNDLLKKFTENKEKFSKIFRNMTKLEYKYDLFLLMMIFSNNDKHSFEEFIKELWASHKPEKLDGYAEVIKEKKKKEREIKINESLKPIEVFYKEIRILDKKNNNIMKLLEKIEALGLDPSFNLNFDKISVFLEFYKKYLNMTPTIVIDSLDESQYFLNKNSKEKPALKTFISSAFGQNILTRVYDMTLEIIYFFPKLDGLDIYSFIEKKDKIPIVELQWNRAQLKNYGDFVIKSMESEQQNPCQKFPNFHELVDYEKNSDIIDLLETPRQINIFMRFLIDELNSQCEKNCFKVTKEDVKHAYEKAKKIFIKNTK